MISYAHRPSSAAVISAIKGATLSASLRTGTTMETATASGSEDGKSGLVVWAGPQPATPRPAAAAFASYGADAPGATPLRRPNGGLESGSIAPSAAMRNPRRRIANQ